MRRLFVVVAAAVMVSALVYHVLAQTPAARPVTATRVLDNDRATVQRLTVSAGYRDPESRVPRDMIAVQVTPGDMEVVINGEKVTNGHVDAGKVWYVPKTVKHQFSNIGATPYDTLVITLTSSGR
jgi:mannose-6-phosphate isomerase-like protein (cupin superfamily)